jgi:dolichyl-phosphate beta-glucosyltransferase
MMAAPFLSLVIPAYNEEQRLSPSLEIIARYLAAQQYASEIIVVDDGSSDRTCEIVRTWMRRSPVPVRLEQNPRNLGKGAAVRRGMLAATGDYALFSDSDLSTPIESIEKFLPYLKAGESVVIGTRKHPAADITRAQPWLRRNLAKGFVVLANVMLGMKLTDFTCGFKCFSQPAAQAVFSRSRIIGWAFDAEILFLAYRLGYKIVEVPITWAHSSGSRVRLGKDIFSSLLGLLEIGKNSRQGVYDLPTKETLR